MKLSLLGWTKGRGVDNRGHCGIMVWRSIREEKQNRSSDCSAQKSAK